MEEGPGPGREGQGAGRGGGRLHLGCVAVEVGEKANPHGVRTAAGSFQDPQVPDDLGEALPETDAPEVNCQGPGIKESCPTSRVEHFQVIYRHLQDLGFLQLGGALLLEGGGDQAPQFRKAAVDAVSTPLLYDPSAFLPGLHLRRAGGGQRPGHLAGEEEKGKFVRAGGPSPWPGVTSWASTAPCWASVVSQAGRKHRAGVGGDAFSPFSPGPIPPWVKSFPALG